MPKKTTLKGQFLRTSLAMLVLSLLIGVAVMVAVMIFFTVRVPDGEEVSDGEPVLPLLAKQTIGPSRMVPVLVLAGGFAVPDGDGGVHSSHPRLTEGSQPP